MLILLFLILLTPVRLTVTWDAGLVLDLRMWGIGRSFSAESSGDGVGMPRKQWLRLIGTALRTDTARRFLVRHTRLISLQALLRLGLNSAAQTAVLTGLLQQIALLLPAKADIRIQPDFLSDTKLQARCILFWHLGTLLITAAMALTAYFLEAREHPRSHPKEA